MTNTFKKTRGHTDRLERRPRDNGGRDWSSVATRQEMPRIAENHQKLGDEHGVESPLESTEKKQLYHHFDFELLAS